MQNTAMNERDSHEYRARFHSKQLKVYRLMVFYDLHSSFQTQTLALIDKLSHRDVVLTSGQGIVWKQGCYSCGAVRAGDRGGGKPPINIHIGMSCLRLAEIGSTVNSI